MALNYVLLSGVVMLAVAAVMMIWRAPLPWRRLVAVAAVVMLLTAVFDPILVRLHLIAYDYSRTLGVSLFGAPLEDFAYAIVAALFMPYLWEKLKK